ncbi:MAG: hypothetical protein ACYCZU_04550, partial [Devosia sp.]
RMQSMVMTDKLSTLPRNDFGMHVGILTDFETAQVSGANLVPGSLTTAFIFVETGRRDGGRADGISYTESRPKSPEIPGRGDAGQRQRYLPNVF